MLPKSHILIGLIFSIFLYLIFPEKFFQISLFFLASFLIDFDHYLLYVLKKRDYSLKNAYNFFKKMKYFKNRKPTMMLFHTVEILTAVLILGFVWDGFFFIFFGMFVHSIFDIINLNYHNELQFREFSLIKYLLTDKKRYF